MHKGALRRDSALMKGLSVLCSVVLAFGMTPATAFSQPVKVADTPVTYTTAAEDNITEDADARAYLDKNFIAAGNSSQKFLSNGGDAVVKSDDGLTYTVPYKMTSGSESVIDSLRFTYSQYDEYACSITTTDTTYLEAGRLTVEVLPRGTAWLDTGTVESLMDAAVFVQTVQNRQDVIISAPEEVAYHMGWLTKAQLLAAAARYDHAPYGAHLRAVAEDKLVFERELHD